jgi:hypothetical protein
MNGFYAGPRYINVWIDFNRDGDWADANLGTTCLDAPMSSVDEWFVRNLPAPSASGVYTLPSQLLPNSDVSRPFWLRISISDTPAPPNSVGNGPAAGYRFGETEDHLMCRLPNSDLWADCPRLKLKLSDELDGEARVDARTPVTFTAEIEEEASYPVTVTWTIDGPDVTQIGASLAEAAPARADNRLVIVRTIPSPATPRDTVVLGWYGCITCTLRMSDSPSAVDVISPTLISVVMEDADGNTAGDDVIVTVGWRAFAPLILRPNDN